MGFRESSPCEPPEPFFVGIFSDRETAIETCRRLNKMKKDDAFYEVKSVEQNKVYDYEWNVMDEKDYNDMKNQNSLL